MLSSGMLSNGMLSIVIAYYSCRLSALAAQPDHDLVSTLRNFFSSSLTTRPNKLDRLLLARHSSLGPILFKKFISIIYECL